MSKVDLWRMVNLDERVWSNTHAPEVNHKQGWVRPGDVVHLIEHYAENWYQIDYDSSDALGLFLPTSEYHEYWIKDNPNGLFVAIDKPAPEPVAQPFWERFIAWLLDLIERILGG